ncbi:MAG: hypothetical protein QOJ96_1284 [Alphaproteobacteria bacterium]|nr:hypothetical protein [Alphaproteobacteria bacterium]
MKGGGGAKGALTDPGNTALGIFVAAAAGPCLSSGHYARLYVLDCVARSVASMISSRTGYRIGLAALALILGCEDLQNAAADGDTRTLSLHHVHTNENLTVTYKINGRYDDEALKKLNWILRDWRREESTKMDPHLLDLLWEVQREVNAKQAIEIICGYRAPQTNAMLRRRSGGVAQFSQHMLGKAMDFYIPGVPLEDLRTIGLRLQRGGVGFYPTSGSPFVHLDVGNVRHWPTMSRDQLVRVFPNGRTVHIPSDGHPLPGYALARADIERRGNDASTPSLNAARTAGVLTASAAGDSEKFPGNALAKLFGFGNNDVVSSTAATSPAQAVRPVLVADATPAKTPTTLPRSRPAIEAAAVPAPVVRAALAVPPNPQAPAAATAAATLASLSPRPQPVRADTAAPGLALAYAPQPGPELTARPGAIAPRSVPSTAAIPAATSVALKQPLGTPAVVQSTSASAGQRLDDPWLRAAVMAPDLQNFMNTAVLGAFDSRGLSVFIKKPTSSVMMSFSDDPDRSLAAGRFTGNAVVFVATVTFSARLASLQ